MEGARSSGISRSAILLAAVLTISACAVGSAPVAEDPAPADADEAVADADPVEDEPPVAAEQVTVRAVETGPYEGLPDTLPAGVVTFLFEMEDPGDRTTHDFRIEELDEGTPIIARGQSAELTVELEPGTYTVYCSVGAHRERGMEGEFVVEDADV
jgi:plastocyanin